VYRSSSFRIIKSGRLHWVRHLAMMGETKNAYKILMGIPLRECPLEKLRKWEGGRWMEVAHSHVQ